MNQNNFVINIATVNGSGSQSANHILVRSLFRMGLPIGSKNLFPSNIQGLATWFTIRISEKGYIGHCTTIDIKVAMNAVSIYDDIQSVKSGGVFVYNKDLKFDHEKLRPDLINIGIPFREIVSKVTKSIKLKKLLTNMIYVGFLGKILKMDLKVLTQSTQDQFANKPGLIQENLDGLLAGWNYAENYLTGLNESENESTNGTEKKIPYEVKTLSNNTSENKILIDGNTAAGLGLVYGGCAFASWYPITPSSSLVENFIHYAEKLRKDTDEKKTFAVIQAEDELSSIGMVAGAGWAGLRAVTATSGPGLSLMAETAGLCYFAEIPAVIWDVQRAGPSTGLPTRTMQCDVLSALHLSHGDTNHPVLIPSSPKECFEFAGLSLDLAEKLQSLVIVLSDLDLGMNLHISPDFEFPTSSLERGKVLKESDLQKMGNFARYKDIDGDGVAYRTLPGTEDDQAAYFTRGTGHDESSHYTENPEVFQKTLDRLKVKWATAKTMVPPPIINLDKKDSGEKKLGAKTSAVGFILYGSSDYAIKEAQDILKEEKNISSDRLLLRAIPFTDEVEDYIKSHDTLLVIDQNRDGQMCQLLKVAYPKAANKLLSICHYNGLALDAHFIVEKTLPYVLETVSENKTNNE